MTVIIPIQHFNDVYNISDSQLVRKFAHLLLSQREERVPPLNIFSGDAFSPSLEASILRGEHMIPILNLLNIDVACYGNHDFDFGEARLAHLSKQTNFPWLLSNVIRVSGDKKDRPIASGLLAHAQPYLIKEIAGFRIGFFGLGGSDWHEKSRNLLSTTVLCPVATARRLAKHLRNVEACDFVIAVTHMRLAEDLLVTKETEDGDCRVDLLLGGHDHTVIRRFSGDWDDNPDIISPGFRNEDLVKDGRVTDAEGKLRIIKSGSDWSGLSVVQLLAERNARGVAYLSNIKVSQYSDISCLPSRLPHCSCSPLAKALKSIEARITELVRPPVLHTIIPLDGRPCNPSSRETNLGNMLADVARAFYNSQVAIVNNGGIRYKKATGVDGDVVSMKDIFEFTPFNDVFVVKHVQGRTLLQAIQISVSGDEGQFLQSSGLRLILRQEKDSGPRLLWAYCVSRDGRLEKIEPNKKYTVAMASFIASGFDGYECLRDEEFLVDDDNGIPLTYLLLQVFASARPNIAYSAKEIWDDKNHRFRHQIQRARKAVIVDRDENDGLPIICPMMERRIQVLHEENNHPVRRAT